MRATDAPAAVERPLSWVNAEVVELYEQSPKVRSLFLDVPSWPGHRAGQHLDLRLTDEDGYKAQRSYSIASAPRADRLELLVQRLDDGEASPYLTTELRPGDLFEIRGPIGGHFVWTSSMSGPLFLIAGGSGVAPLMAMLRHRAAAGSTIPAILLFSSRTLSDIIYREELDRLAAADSGLQIVHTLTGGSTSDWSGETGRIDRDMLAAAGFHPSEQPRIFVCGPASLIEDVARHLVVLGHEPRMVKTERFGPTGV